MLLTTGTNINIKSIKTSLNKFKSNYNSTFSSTMLNFLRQSNIIFSFTRDIRPHKLQNIENNCGVKRFENLFSGHNELFGREIVNWYLATKNNPACFEDERTTIHLNKLVNFQNDMPSDMNLVSKQTTNYIKNPNSYFYSFLKGRNFPIISLHLGYSVENPILLNINNSVSFYPTEENQVLDKTITFNRIVENINQLKQLCSQVGYQGKFLIETLDYCKNEFGSAYEYVTNPSFIQDVINSTNTSLLLDVAHLICASEHLKYNSIFDYVNKIIKNNSNKIDEIHLTVPQQIGNTWYDTHRNIFDSIDSQEFIPFLSTLEFILKSKKQDQKVIINFESQLPTVHLDTVVIASFLRQIFKS